MGSEEVVSLDLPAEAFEVLRGRRDLRTVCCGAPAVAKRSVRGLPFFAHGKRGDCPAGEETAFHLHGKALIARAAREAGWTAEVEAAGHTPAGERWRADVLCCRGILRVAFELQRSGITLASLHARQERYRASGVRAMWFMRTHERALSRAQPWQQATPAFFVTEQHQVPALGLGLGAAVQAALGGQLALFPWGGRAVQVTVIAQVKRCLHYRCRGFHGVLAAVLVCPSGQPDLAVVMPGTTAGLAAWVDEVLPPGEGGRYVPWPTTLARTYPCPGCGRVGSMNAFKPDPAKWRQLASRLPGEPEAQAWRYQQGETDVRTVGAVLSEAQLDWVTRAAGRRWLLQAWTD